MKTCSYCGREYPDDATVCAVDQTPLVADVPEAAPAATETAAPEPAVKSSSDAVMLGWFFIWAGIIGVLYFTFAFSTSLPGSDVVNLDRQQNRLFGFLESQVTFLAGLLMVLIKKKDQS